MKRNEIVLLILGLLILYSISEYPFAMVCTETKVYTDFRTQSLNFGCTYNYGCTYQTSCPSSDPIPAESGQLGHGESVIFSCSETSEYITISITGKTCVQSAVVLTPLFEDTFRTDENIIVKVKVDGAGEGYIVHGRINELNLEKDGIMSFGIAEIDFGNLVRGSYTLELWGDNAQKITRQITVYGVMDLSYSATPIQPYNFVDANIYLKDENGVGIGKEDFNIGEGITVKVHPKGNTLQIFPFSELQYLGKDDVSGGRFYISGDTQGYIGDIIMDVTVRKNGYLEANEQIQIQTFIPSLIIEVRCTEFDCPFPNSAELGETKDFTFWTRKGEDKVDADVSVKVTNPSRTIVDRNVPVTCVDGTCQFSYGPFDEIEAWTFTIYAEYPGVDPQTIEPKVSVTKEEKPIFISPWMFVLLIPIGYLLYEFFKKKR